ncbi:hypothetical protein HPB51_021188 [Rhipicephalus microplus]|uniref:Uncharacterized protein n=1 Tax=Rhipicephalus microplus TaxID=6941 RepID=A0A9J6F944_RHIMP|nr:hypothetical protein HPB51_021188 [Rhipicephalus microplus]
MRYARKRRGPAAAASAAAAANAGYVPAPVEGGNVGEVVEDFSNSASGTYLILTDNPTWWRHPLDTRALSREQPPNPVHSRCYFTLGRNGALLSRCVFLHVGQAYYQARQPQQGPPQPPNPQAAPPQVQVGPQQVGAGGGRGPGGGGPPAMGRPPPLAQAAQLALSPLGTPPGAPPQTPVAAAGYPGALMPNFANQAAGYPAPQHMSQQPIILGNCMPYSQRPGQFSPAPQFVYHQPTYLPAQPATQMFYNTQGMVSVSLPASGGPPQVQAPRGQQAYQQGASQLQPRPRCIIEIKDPVTGRNVLEDLKSTPDETAPVSGPC